MCHPTTMPVTAHAAPMPRHYLRKCIGLLSPRTHIAETGKSWSVCGVDHTVRPANLVRCAFLVFFTLPGTMCKKRACLEQIARPRPLGEIITFQSTDQFNTTRIAPGMAQVMRIHYPCPGNGAIMQAYVDHKQFHALQSNGMPKPRHCTRLDGVAKTRRKYC